MFECDLCHRTFKVKKNFNRHQKIACIGGDNREIKCPLCEFTFYRLQILREHITKEHAIPITQTEKTFQSNTDFETWKRELEQKGSCVYTCRNKYSLKNGSQVRYVHTCHRSGVFASKSEGKKKLKPQGSNKIGKTCPSMMIVTKDKDETSADEFSTVHVLFYPVHVGHSLSFGRCHLSDEDKAWIADRIEKGIPADDILDEIRDNVSNASMITKRHLWRIKRDYGLPAVVHQRQYSSDNTCVRLWIKKMLISEDNPLLHSDLQTNNFVLIIATRFQLKMLKSLDKTKLCIDSVRGTAVNDFQLTSLVVIDEHDEGYPAAYCVSNKKDAATWKLFFQKIKDAVGIIKADVFMSDDDPSYHNAWEEVMAPAQHKITCSWNIDQNWRRDIQTKVKTTHYERSMVYGTLKLIQCKTKESEFHHSLQETIKEFTQKRDTKEFGEYFNNIYASRPETWADYYRISYGIKTSKNLESLHKCFKHFYSNALNNNRFDKCLDAVLKLSRDDMFENLFKKVTCQKTEKEVRIRRSHLDSEELTSSVVKISNDLWKVPSTKDAEVRYEVQKISEKCVETCVDSCIPCNTCIHEFSCCCSDYIIRATVCKHIHAVCKGVPSKNRAEVEICEAADEKGEKESNLLTNRVDEVENDTNEVFELHESLKNKHKVLSEFIRTNCYSKEQLITFNQKFDHLIQEFQQTEGKRKRQSEANYETEPSTKKIKPQAPIRLMFIEKPIDKR